MTENFRRPGPPFHEAESATVSKTKLRRSHTLSGDPKGLVRIMPIVQMIVANYFFPLIEFFFSLKKRVHFLGCQDLGKLGTVFFADVENGFIQNNFRFIFPDGVSGFFFNFSGILIVYRPELLGLFRSEIQLFCDVCGSGRLEAGRAGASG